MATGYQIPDSNDESEDGNLVYDWEDCETLQIVRAFPISDYGTNSDQSSTDEFLVPEPPSLSGIADSTIGIRQPRSLTDVNENYIEDDVSSLTSINSINISDAPRKHRFAKERVEREGNIYDKLYNACLKGKLSTVKDIGIKHRTVMEGEDGQTPLYAACIGEHTEMVKLLINFGYDVNHQDKEGKTPLHITFENHAPDLAHTLITQFKANTEIRDKQNWTPLHTAIDRGYYSYSHELSQRFLHKDAGTDVSWIQLHSACFKDNKQDVQFLLAANTDVNHVSSAGYTPLHIAVNRRNTDLVTLLLDQDVNVHNVTIDGKTPLHIAAEKGDETIIQKLLAQKADPSLKDAPGNTSLHLAVQDTGAANRYPLAVSYHTCSIKTVQAIIDNGADVNAVNNKGQTPLWLACCDGQEAFVATMLDAGADPSIADKNGDSCLHAAMNGHCSTGAIQKIVDHGAHVNAVNKDETTPLLLACSTAQAESVELLLTIGADANIADADGDTTILNAIEGCCSVNTMQKLLNNGVNVNITNNTGLTALLKACAYRQTDVVKVLLEAGADPNIVDDVHYSSLHAAVDGRCSKHTLRTLIDHGAHIDATRKDGTNALLRACTTGQAESVMFLLEAGASANITKHNGNNCLHEAIIGHCSAEALQKIVQQGVNVNAVNMEGKTALMLACYAKQADSIKILLDRGSDPNISDAGGYTSLHAAVSRHCTNDTLEDIISSKVHLDAQDAIGVTALWLACLYRQQDSVKILLEAGSNPDIASTDRYTCLHAAVNAGCSKNIILAILDHSTDVNVAGTKNETALMLACCKGNKNVINILLNAGADPKIVHADGDTCLHDAVRGNCSKEVLQTIINYGADINATGKQNRTALMIACLNGSSDAINVLLDAGANPHIANDTGNICLHEAVRGDCSKEVLQRIISHSVDVNATNMYDITTIMIACEKGNIDAINVLLNAGADPNIVNFNGATCLHCALSGGCSPEILQTIINHGVDVNAKKNNSKTALIRACEKGNSNAIKVLLNAEADPNIAHCLHCAVTRRCSKEVLQALINHGADVNATNKSNETALMKAYKSRNKDAINVLLNAGVDPNIADVDGNTCLHYAANRDCSKDFLQVIINHGADVNAVNKSNQTSLILACVKGSNDAIKVLLKAGADLKIADADGDTCIHHAARNDCCTQVIKSIITDGVDVNATNKYNETALLIACKEGKTDVIHILINARADPNIPDDKGATCIHHAVRKGCSKDALEAIVHLCTNVNATDKNNETALMIACKRGNKDAMNVLLTVGATNCCDPNGDTCLHYAVRNDCCTEVFQSLITHGVDVEVTNMYNETALLIACKEGKNDAINVLLNAGADPYIPDGNGATCIHHAVGEGCNKDVIETIVNHDVDINATDKNNATALMIACKRGNKDAINVLLTAGADPNIADIDGDTCLHSASRNNSCTDILQAIINHGADVNATRKNITALMIASKNGNIDAVNVLLKAGADTTIVDIYGNTCLQLSVVSNYNKIVQTIIDHGADVNATNNNNHTALVMACVKGNEDAINVLLNAGADTSIVSVCGNTWLHCAILAGCNKKILQIICDHGADVNVMNNEGATALMLACGRQGRGSL